MKNLNIIANDLEFLAALRTGIQFRRTQIAEGLRKRNAADDLCDSDLLLAELVNHCFWSSIAVEEGRTTRGAICICSPDEAPLARSLQAPVPVTVKNLVALLTASPQSSLAVQAAENGPVIWGFLDAIPMFALKLRVAGTGIVVASADKSVLAVIQGGAVQIPKNAGETGWIMLVANALDKANSFPDRLRIAARYLRVVTTILRQGHGGALVVGPTSTDAWKTHIKFAFSFDDSSSLVLRSRLNEWEEAEKRHHSLETGQSGETPISLLGLYAQSAAAYRNLVDVTLQSIGDLSAIDGAVVMDEDLKVFGFGAKLQVKSDEFQVLVLDALTGQTATVPYAQLGGTRHQSAACFVHQNTDAIVFVASQDGRLTLFAWVADPGLVVTVRSLEHFVWEYRA